MTRSLYGWKPPSAATDHLKQQEQRDAAERARTARDSRIQSSRDWLTKYRAKSHPTNFNWSGMSQPTITKETDDEAGKITQAAEVDHEEGVGDTAG